MTDINTFLAERYAEDKLIALATTPVPVAGRWKVAREKNADRAAPLALIQADPAQIEADEEDEPGYECYNRYAVIAHAADWQHEAESNLRHIARHDPSRVLAEVEAKRRRLQRHRPETTEYYDRHGSLATFTACEVCGDHGDVQDAWPCDDLRDDAAPYADHADYDDDWRPEV